MNKCRTRKPTPKPADTAKLLRQMKALYSPSKPDKQATTNDNPNPKRQPHEPAKPV